MLINKCVGIFWLARFILPTSAKSSSTRRTAVAWIHHGFRSTQRDPSGHVGSIHPRMPINPVTYHGVCSPPFRSSKVRMSAHAGGPELRLVRTRASQGQAKVQPRQLTQITLLSCSSTQGLLLASCSSSASPHWHKDNCEPTLGAQQLYQFEMITSFNGRAAQMTDSEVRSAP